MLTVEELKALPYGNWVWIEVLKEEYPHDFLDTGYYRKSKWSDGDKLFDTGWHGSGTSFLYENYGTSWLAYKNKEEAERIPELKKFVDDFCDYLLESKNNCLDDERGDIQACVYEEVFQIFGRMIESRFGIKVFDEQGEAWLKKLQERKK